MRLQGRIGKPVRHLARLGSRSRSEHACLIVTGAFAEFERSMIRQRINAGLKRAVEAGKTLGRPRISEIEKHIQEQLRTGKGINKVAHEVGVGTGTSSALSSSPASFTFGTKRCSYSIIQRFASPTINNRR
ncbi:MAG: recombinase family protein [Xanthobacteraceae bacterium]